MRENEWHETSIRVRYRDTDRMGVVYYANFFAFFEVGRAELLRDLGFPYSRMEEEGYMLVVIEAAARYQGNVGYDSVIRMRCNISDITKTRLRFEYQALNAKDKLLVTGHTVHVCMDMNNNITKLPTAFKSVVTGKP